MGSESLARVFHAPRPSGMVSRIQQKAFGTQKFQPLPPPTGPLPYHLALDSILTTAQMESIQADSKLVFHTAGDTGNVQGECREQQSVADAMEQDIASGAGASFFYHLGDIIYFSGQAEGYHPQFYEPYRNYSAPILGIPGNHDGDPRPTDPPSLTAFVRNFCAAVAGTSVDAQDAPRSTMTQPNVYWTLEAPFVNIVGLYSNVPEGGQVAPEQLAWLAGELKNAPPDKAVILAVHHPIYSLDKYHAGSTSLEETLDATYATAGRRPDLVLTGHVHDFQRFTEVVDGWQVPHLVAGAGGHRYLHPMRPQADGSPLQVPYKLVDADDVTLENYCADRHGFMRIEVTDGTISGDYLAIDPSSGSPGAPARVVDGFELDTKEHKLTRNTRVP